MSKGASVGNGMSVANGPVQNGNGGRLDIDPITGEPLNCTRWDLP